MFCSVLIFVRFDFRSIWFLFRYLEIEATYNNTRVTFVEKPATDKCAWPSLRSCRTDYLALKAWNRSTWPRSALLLSDGEQNNTRNLARFGVVRPSIPCAGAGQIMSTSSSQFTTRATEIPDSPTLGSVSAQKFLFSAYSQRDTMLRTWAVISVPAHLERECVFISGLSSL
jgi:hypothetical protein